MQKKIPISKLIVSTKQHIECVLKVWKVVPQNINSLFVAVKNMGNIYFLFYLSYNSQLFYN